MFKGDRLKVYIDYMKAWWINFWVEFFSEVDLTDGLEEKFQRYKDRYKDKYRLVKRAETYFIQNVKSETLIEFRWGLDSEVVPFGLETYEQKCKYKFISFCKRYERGKAPIEEV